MATRDLKSIKDTMATRDAEIVKKLDGLATKEDVKALENKVGPILLAETAITEIVTGGISYAIINKLDGRHETIHHQNRRG
jgi:hypothetical protein